jgi:hypothetical protein
MTKAKDNNDHPLAELARARIEKALELLDKVERGGILMDDVLESIKGKDFKLENVLKAMGKKYILIERK